MDKKVIADIIAVIVIILLAYLFVYVPYMNEENIKNYNAGLQKASAIDQEMNESFNKATNVSSSNVNGGLEATTQALKDSQSKIDEKIEILNETRSYANGNVTKEQYIDYELQLAQLEKDMTSEMLKEYEDFGDAFKNTDIVKMMNVSDQMVKTVNSKNDEAAPIRDNILKLLGDNPDFNQTLHDLNLSEDYYGDLNLTHVSV